MDPKVFGSFIQLRRKELGMNQAELAEKLHVTAKAVSRWERGVGFPSIELLQPLADALEITIAELMQSKLLEKNLPKEEVAALVSQTVETIRKQEALNWKGKLILYSGYAVFFVIYVFLHNLGLRYDFEPRWIGLALGLIAICVYFFGIRALRSLLTGAPFFEERPRKKWQFHTAGILFWAGVAILLASMALVTAKGLRDFLAIVGLLLAFFSGCYMSIFSEELNK